MSALIRRLLDDALAGRHPLRGTEVAEALAPDAPARLDAAMHQFGELRRQVGAHRR